MRRIPREVQKSRPPCTITHATDGTKATTSSTLEGLDYVIGNEIVAVSRVIRGDVILHIMKSKAFAAIGSNYSIVSMLESEDSNLKTECQTHGLDAGIST